ncbi:hypothetical protein HPB49_018903 [Dermacentor silvarum]|uniref:Uncharacterized protein n=1 Tax=Dermacentor silvarum TaxID=543639 RepID=A0ACB8DKL9_DERSI|nr:hypothetical protein HPB49_018903 [Dermacentor silvarum]
MDVQDASGATMGSLRMECTMIYAKFSVLDSEKNVVLLIKGPLCTSSICCNDVVFDILATDGVTKLGAITKVWTGMLRETFSDADNFAVTFPLDLDVKIKAVLIGAVFLIKIHVLDASGAMEKNVVMLIKGPCCTESWHCRDVVFDIVTKDGVTKVGAITKNWTGWITEAYTDPDNYAVTFPLDFGCDDKGRAAQCGLFNPIVGIEMKNKYVVKNSMGQFVFTAAEQSDICCRHCCGSRRPFQMSLLDYRDVEVLRLSRPLRCDCCLCFCCLQACIYRPKYCKA